MTPPFDLTFRLALMKAQGGDGYLQMQGGEWILVPVQVRRQHRDVGA